MRRSLAALSMIAGLLIAPPSADITRDTTGIAHIRAKSLHDLFYHQGWVHADDRLFQMDVSRRRASGTLAELLGATALPGDRQMRTFGLRRAAEKGLAVLSPQTRQALDAYAEGVNAWTARNGSSSMTPRNACRSRPCSTDPAGASSALFGAAPVTVITSSKLPAPSESSMIISRGTPAAASTLWRTIA